MNFNMALMTDSYKLTHHLQYPKGTQRVYSHFLARVGSEYPYTVMSGLKVVLNRLKGVVITQEDIDKAEEFTNNHIGPNIFNRPMWEHIVKTYGGKLPVTIKAVPEGTVVPNDNVLMTIENNDPMTFALTNHLETLLCQLWYSCNVSTLSRLAKETMKKYIDDTSDNPNHLDYMLHDFGFRGASCPEQAAIGGAAHLINFLGTDTPIAISLILDLYKTESFPGYSVPATEHSVMTALGREGEFEQVQNVLDQHPTGIISIVSDSYDIYDAIRMYGTRFKEQILSRDGKFVARPDSGNPVDVIIKCLDIFETFYETTTNSKGFKVLPPQLGMLWGDGLDLSITKDILHATKMRGWSADNFVFGMGGGLIQKHNRDTQRFAFKASAIQINDEWHDVFKSPKEGRKASRAGRLALSKMGEHFYTRRQEEAKSDYLETVFKNGEVFLNQTWEDIRKLAAV